MPMIVDTESSVFSAPGLPDETLSSPTTTPTPPYTSELMGNVGPHRNTTTEEQEKNLWHHVLLDLITPPSPPFLPPLLILSLTHLLPFLCNKCVLFRPLIMPQKRIFIFFSF